MIRGRFYFGNLNSGKALGSFLSGSTKFFQTGWNVDVAWSERGRTFDLSGRGNGCLHPFLNLLKGAGNLVN
jgi:hypothetical protein